MGRTTYDEYRLVINPVLAGQGLNLFRRFPGPIDLHLASARAFETGAVLNVYVVKAVLTHRAEG